MLTIRDAKPSDAPFLAECILAGMHFYDFEGFLSDDMTDLFERFTECEGREDTLYSWKNTRLAEVDGVPAGALLSYPGELYLELRDKTFREYWPAFFTEHPASDPEADPGEYYLDSLAVHPDYRKQGIGKALLEDGVIKGASQGFKRISIIAETEYPHLIRYYESLGFVQADYRNVFGTDFQRLIYTLPE